MTANIPINRCPFPVLGHHPFLVHWIYRIYIFIYRYVKHCLNTFCQGETKELKISVKLLSFCIFNQLIIYMNY